MSVLNQKIDQKLLQKLSPQQIQLIKLLEVPIIELEQKIKKEIEENPALEEGDYEEDMSVKEDEAEEFKLDDNELESESDTENTDEILYDNEFSIDDYYDEEEIPNYKLKDNNYAEESDKPQTYYSVGSSFQEYLFTQLAVLDLSDNERVICEYIVGNLDEAGYVRRDLEAISDDLLVLQNLSVSLNDIEKVLNYLQEELEPSGVCARDLKECLILQVKRKQNLERDNQLYDIVLSVLSDFFEEFSKKHYDKILNKLDIDDEELRLIIKEVIKLNPKPGHFYASQTKRNELQIVPDFILTNDEGELILTVNSFSVPALQVNKSYENLLKTFNSTNENIKKDKDAITFVKEKIDSAKWFIEAIKQRENTLERTMLSIMNFQKDFFRTGDETYLRPMILKDIAEKTNLDISTISRVANSKYIQTPYGIFPLKFFFSEGMENSEGEEVSTRKIKKILKEAIENENKKRPLTDERLAKLLQDEGYRIARRTVAKYREQMGILVARLRKKI